MKVTDYLSYIVEKVPKDALFVSSHVANTNAILVQGLAGRCLLGFNMGFSTSVGLGVALGLPKRRVVILDGDGGVLLLPSALLDLATQSPKNAIVVINDNESSLLFPSHTSRRVNIAGLARAAGIKNVFEARTIDEFKDEFSQAIKREELTYIVAKTENTRIQVPPTIKIPNLQENKFNFVRFVEDTEHTRIIQ